MMSDSVKVYEGGIPTPGFTSAYKTSNEAESNYVPGGPATRPGTVNQGGPTQPKTYSQSASEDFLMSSTYKTNMEAGRPGAMDIDNPDDISHADHNDDPDLPNK